MPSALSSTDIDKISADLQRAGPNNRSIQLLDQIRGLLEKNNQDTVRGAVSGDTNGSGDVVRNIGGEILDGVKDVVTGRLESFGNALLSPLGLSVGSIGNFIGRVSADTPIAPEAPVSGADNKALIGALTNLQSELEKTTPGTVAPAQSAAVQGEISRAQIGLPPVAGAISNTSIVQGATPGSRVAGIASVPGITTGDDTIASGIATPTSAVPEGMQIGPKIDLNTRALANNTDAAVELTQVMKENSRTANNPPTGAPFGGSRTAESGIASTPAAGFGNRR